MPPCNTKEIKQTEDSTIAATSSIKSLQLNEIRKSLPKEVFKKSVPKALGYMIFDYLIWFLCLYSMIQLSKTNLWSNLAFWQKSIIALVYWNLQGFFMWCIFITGHDCGHGTFSDSELLNDFIGHLTHGSILVPYYPWQLSHRRHHMYHNHVDKDYSYPWYTEDRLTKDDEYMARFLHDNPLAIFFFPFYGWPIYFILGLPDGNHLIPYAQERLWKETPAIEFFKCYFSAVIVLGFLLSSYYFFDYNVIDLGYYYLVPWIIFGWWLISVTYLQHHDPHTLVYDDKNWKFVDAAFETVDRKFGYGIDTLHHHITDGHVVHHLFFTKIPHYNLPLATKALISYLKDNNLYHLYRYEDTFDFPYRVHKNFVQFGFRSHRADEVDKKSK